MNYNEQHYRPVTTLEMIEILADLVDRFGLTDPREIPDEVQMLVEVLWTMLEKTLEQNTLIDITASDGVERLRPPSTA